MNDYEEVFITSENGTVNDGSYDAPTQSSKLYSSICNPLELTCKWTIAPIQKNNQPTRVITILFSQFQLSVGDSIQYAHVTIM